MIAPRAPLAAGMLALAACAPVAPAALGAPGATPCAQRAALAVTIEKIEVHAPDGRAVPIEIVRPAVPGRYPLIAFSHGALAAPDRYHALLKPLAASGYVVLAPTHLESEAMDHETPPPREDVWRTRVEDIEIALAVPGEIAARLSDAEVSVDLARKATVGHSYGALIAQLPAGAMAIEPDGSARARRDPSVATVVAFSPPGPIDDMIAPEGWHTIAVPSLTITGTRDIQPGFMDRWQLHAASFENAPRGARWLWIGEGIDHYFGGMFGREKPADAEARRLFARALATTIHFLDAQLLANGACRLSAPVAGETLEKD